MRKLGLGLAGIEGEAGAEREIGRRIRGRGGVEVGAGRGGGGGVEVGAGAGKGGGVVVVGMMRSERG